MGTDDPWVGILLPTRMTLYGSPGQSLGDAGPSCGEGSPPGERALTLADTVRHRDSHNKHAIFPVLALQILTRDSVTTQVDGVVYYRIYSAVSAVANVNDVHQATFLLAQTTLRNVLGTQTLSQILAGREEIAHSIQVKTLRTNSLCP